MKDGELQSWLGVRGSRGKTDKLRNPVRKKTLSSVCFILALAIVFALKRFARAQGTNLPIVGFVSPLIASFIIVPLLIVPLAAVNQYVLAWRKAHGRDIEAEEKHEFDDTDIISLRPRQPHEHSSTYRRWGDDEWTRIAIVGR